MQINFLADSLAGRGFVSPRRLRDICKQDRAKMFHYIIRQDYYVECTFRYKVPRTSWQMSKVQDCQSFTTVSPFYLGTSNVLVSTPQLRNVTYVTL